MASSIAAIAVPRSMDFSRATASAICSSSSLLALTAAMALVSSSGVDLASPQSFCGEAVFLGVFRGVLFIWLQFQLRFVALGGVAFPGMRRWRRLKPEIPAQLALRRLAPPHRFPHQPLRPNPPGLPHIFPHPPNFRLFPPAPLPATQPP